GRPKGSRTISGERFSWLQSSLASRERKRPEFAQTRVAHAPGSPTVARGRAATALFPGVLGAGVVAQLLANLREQPVHVEPEGPDRQRLFQRRQRFARLVHFQVTDAEQAPLFRITAQLRQLFQCA